jgi:hypothetical protein
MRYFVYQYAPIRRPSSALKPLASADLRGHGEGMHVRAAVISSGDYWSTAPGRGELDTYDCLALNCKFHHKLTRILLSCFELKMDLDRIRMETDPDVIFITF